MSVSKCNQTEWNTRTTDSLLPRPKTNWNARIQLKTEAKMTPQRHIYSHKMLWPAASASSVIYKRAQQFGSNQKLSCSTRLDDCNLNWCVVVQSALRIDKQLGKFGSRSKWYGDWATQIGRFISTKLYIKSNTNKKSSLFVPIYIYIKENPEMCVLFRKLPSRQRSFLGQMQ